MAKFETAYTLVPKTCYKCGATLSAPSYSAEDWSMEVTDLTKADIEILRLECRKAQEEKLPYLSPIMGIQFQRLCDFALRAFAAAPDC